MVAYVPLLDIRCIDLDQYFQKRAREKCHWALKWARETIPRCMPDNRNQDIIRVSTYTNRSHYRFWVKLWSHTLTIGIVTLTGRASPATDDTTMVVRACNYLKRVSPDWRGPFFHYGQGPRRSGVPAEMTRVPTDGPQGLCEFGAPPPCTGRQPLPPVAARPRRVRPNKGGPGLRTSRILGRGRCSSSIQAGIRV